jgi:hypothetical protein
MDLSGVTRNVVLPVRVDPRGQAGPTKNQARGPRWRRSSHAYYVPSHVDATTVDQRAVEAAAALQEDWGGVTGWAGLGWLRGRWFDGSPWGGGPVRPVTLAVGGNRWTRQQQYFATSEERLAPGDLIVVDGLRVTTAVRSVCFEMRYAKDKRDAAITLSMACYDDLVSIDEASAYAATLRGWTGIPQCREAIPLATENAWSPLEVVMDHTWWLDACLPRALANVPIFDREGKFLGTPDLVDPVAGVVGQYNGALHLAGAQHARDVDKEDLYRAHGLECVTMLAGDARDPSRFIVRLLAAYDRAADKPPDRRLWTLHQPDWWHDTTSVAARRSLSPYLRAKLLRHRAA